VNLLTEALPNTVDIGGGAWPINTDFREGVRFELLMQTGTLTDEERMGRALRLFYPKLPEDISAALDGMLWFYSCGRYEPRKPAAGDSGPQKKQREKKVYDFDQDAELIFAAFRAVYGIDLNTVEGLHWWKFRALFSTLPADCEFCKVMGYRAMDTKGLSKKQKQHYEKMKRLYALKNEVDVGSALSLGERNQRMREYVDRRFEEMEAGEKMTP